MKRRSPPTRTALRFFASFLLLLVPFLLITNLVVFRVFVPTLQDETAALNGVILRNTQIALDERVFRPVEEVYRDTVLDRTGLNPFYAIEYDPSQNLWRSVDVIRGLKELVSSSDPPLHAVSIHFPARRYVLSSQGFSFLDRSDGILTFPWASGAEAEGVERWTTTESVVDYNTVPHRTESMLLYRGPYPPTPPASGALAYVAVELPLRVIDQIVREYADFSPGVFRVSGPSGETLYRSGLRGAEPDEVAGASVSQVASTVEGIRYEYTIPRDVFFAKSTQLRNRLYLAMTVTIVVSLVISWVIARAVSQPIEQVAATARSIADRLHLDSSGYQGGGPADGIVGIGATIEGLAERIEGNLPIIKEKFFADLLAGTLTPDEARRRMSVLALEELPPVLQVAVIEFDGDRLSTILRQRVPDQLAAIGEDLVLFTVPFGRRRLALISASNDEDQLTGFCTDLYERVVGTDRPVKGSMGSVVVGVGDPVRSIGDVATSYATAVRRLSRRFITGNPVIVEDAPGGDAPLIEDLMPTDAELGEVLATEDVDTVGELLFGLRDAARETRDDMESLRRAVCRLAERIRRFMRRMGDTSVADALDCDFARFDTVGELFGSWRTAIGDYFEDLRAGRGDAGSGLIDGVTAFLREHYRDDVSLGDLAERFEVSYSHLSKVFHDRVGVTFRDFVQNLRLDKAAELLRDTNLPVKSVAFEVGFRDTGYFIRRFKRRTGATPVHYRSQVRLPSGDADGDVPEGDVRDVGNVDDSGGDAGGSGK